MKGDARVSRGRTAIVVCAWNHLETTTRPCLESIAKFTGGAWRVLCVDNGSRDGTGVYLEALAARDPRFVRVSLDENRGWAGGSLAALDRLEAEDRRICLLNSDTIVTPGWLTRLERCLESAPASTVVNPVERPALPVLDRRPEPAGGHSGPDGVPTLDPGTGKLPGPCSVERVIRIAKLVARRHAGRWIEAPPSGFCLLLPTSLLPVLRDYLVAFDRFHDRELDWQVFLRDREVRCRRALDTFVHHARGGSGGYYRYR